ncbi:MAG: DUF1552 domain-containing protein [Lentisphaeraceae bacterium]|nr:DUF1552 domain-containing protein [Lentisphaeraceae bacterium]
MKSKSWKLNRRTFLHGTGVLCFLPYLEAMADTKAAKAPLRYLNLYFGNGVSLPPKKYADLRKDWHWFPHNEGKDYKMTKVLKPLAGHRDNLTVIGGLSHPRSRKLVGHHAADSWLTGADVGNEYSNSISLDQLVAEKFKKETRYSYMNLSTDGGTGFRGRTTTLAFNRAGRPVPAENKPRDIFERFFQTGDEKSAIERKKELIKKRRIVDLLLVDSKKLQSNLGKHDQEVLERHMETLRDLEERIEQMEKWQHIPLKKFDAGHIDLSATVKDPLKYIRGMLDLMVLSFEIDITRVANYMIVREDNLGIGTHFSTTLFGFKDHHRMSHGNDEKTYKNWAQYDRFLSEQLNYLLDRLSESKDEHGSLLDNTLVLYGSSTSTNHDAVNCPIILAGAKNMGLKHGRYLKYDEKKTRLSDLYVSMQNALGIQSDKFSDSKGRIDDIFKA